MSVKTKTTVKDVKEAQKHGWVIILCGFEYFVTYFEALLI